MSSRRLTLQAVPPIKGNTTFVGAGLLIAGGIFQQIAAGTDNDSLGISGVALAVAGVLIIAVGSLLTRNTPHQTPDKQATLAAIGCGIVLLLVAVTLVFFTSLTGIAFILSGIAAALINLSDYITRGTAQTQEDYR